MHAQTPTLAQIVQRSRDLLDEQEAAQLLTVAPGTLSVWRSTGRYNLPFLKVGRNVRYRRADLLAWLEKRTRESGATA
jgi:excisionase family DNA binding protein